MKNLLRILVSLSFLFIYSQTNAQESTYVRTPGYWTIGINGGLAYQSSDVKSTLDGWGVGATLAKNLYYRPGAPFAFDLRGRLLYDQSYGLDHKPSFGIENNPVLNRYRTELGGLGYSYLNHKTHHGELGLEGVLSFNRLREKTNINLSLFGGIGLDYYATLTDLENSNGDIYDYSLINANGRRQSNKAELENLRDGNYETKAEGFGENGQLAFMPALGLELGYQLTPRFSIGLGHKLTFTRTDLFDGNQWGENNRVTGNNDLHHYTNLHLRWIIESEKEEARPPIIEIMTPIASPHSTRDPLAIIKARIKNINSAMDIDYMVNGRVATFDFRNEILDDDFYLRPGRNFVDITATNSAGSDRERVIIIYDEGGVVVNPPPTTPTTEVRLPRVNFTNPSRSTSYVATERYNVSATVLNVERRRDIEFKLNGRTVSDFDFDSRRDRFTSSIRLRQGENRLRISVCNANGATDEDEAVIILEREEIIEELPIVNIVRPSADPFRTEDNSFNIQAEVFNVNDKIDIAFTVNGTRVRSFNFSNNRVTGRVNLKEGNNIIKITGKNESGRASDETTIIYEIEETIDPPTVKITSISQPTIDPFNPNQCKVTIVTRVENVENKDNIDFYFDGKSYNSFNYTPSRSEVRAVLTLDAGKDYNVRIKASNSAGSDEDSETISSCSGTPEGKAPKVDITAPTKTTTENSKVILKASVEEVSRKSDITVFVNGKNIRDFSYDSRRNAVSATANLKEGSNRLKVTAKNSYGSDSDEVSIRYNKVITTPKQPPVVDINSPRNNSTTYETSVDLTATVKYVVNKKDISILVNGRKVNSFNFQSRGGKVTTTISGLKEGTNTITVKASNKDGRDEASVKVTYKKRIASPSVNISSPRDRFETTKSSVQLKATLKNVASKSDITVKVNGRNIKDFSFRSNQVTATVSLRVGANDIYVEGRNSAGKADDQVRVIFDQPILPPKVSIRLPKKNATTDKSSVEVKADLANVKSKNDITLKVNGKTIRDFSYSRNQLSATVSLKDGPNEIFVEGRNASGKDDDKVKVTYIKKVAPPKVKITSPRDGMTSSKSTVTLKASITNVTSNRDITVKVNGKTISRYTFKKGQLSVNVQLKKGRNALSVEARNDGGRSIDQVTVTYVLPSNPPEITGFGLSQPTVDPFNPNVGKSSVSATLKNVSSKSQIQLIINGSAVRDFDFTTKSGKLRKVFSLNQGTNTVKIIVDNGDGRDEETKTINF
ncbi:MAG: hypothetical protein AB8F74_22350 [Saprospiraceae bacterium]